MEIFSGNASQRLLLSPTRIYDPIAGRFLQNEPLLNRRAHSHYLYLPINSLDPSGAINLPNEAAATGRLTHPLQRLTPEQYKCLKLAVQRVEYWLDPQGSADKDFVGPLLPDPIPRQVQNEIAARGGNLAALASHTELIDLPEASQSMTVIPYVGASLGHSGATGQGVSINKRLLIGCVNSKPPEQCKPGEADQEYFIELIAETIVHEISHNLNVRRRGTPGYVDETTARRELGFEAEQNIWGRTLGVDQFTGQRQTGTYDPATGRVTWR